MSHHGTVTWLAASVLALAAAAVLPSTALASSSVWADAGAGAPATVNLAAVASTGSGTSEVVVAVGRDTSSGEAVIYRDAGGSWNEDTITGLPADSCLDTVAVDSQAAWAGGSSGGGCPGDGGATGTPFLVRLGNVIQPVSAAWTTVSYPGPKGAAIRAVALSGAGDADVGDSAGNLYWFSDAASPTFTQLSLTPQPSAIDSITLTAAQTGYAVGAGSDGIYQLSPGANGAEVAAPAPFKPPAPTAEAAIAAGGGSAVAIDGSGYSPGWWAPTNGVWQHSADAAAFDGATLKGVGLGAAGTVIVGTDGSGRGTIWIGTTSFAHTTVSCSSVNAVDSTGSWVVGDAGTVLTLTQGGTAAGCTPPPPPPSPGTGSNGSGGSGGGYDAPPPSPSQQNGSGQSSSSSGSSDGVRWTVSQPPARVPAPSAGRRVRRHRPATTRKALLVSDVRVSVERGKLLVQCKLSGSARVSAIAMTGTRILGRVGWEQFRGGVCELVIPYTGRIPPAQLRIVARPLPPATPVSNRARPDGAARHQISHSVHKAPRRRSS